MFAIIQTGGKQYRVAKGDKIKIEKIPEPEGAKIAFDQVLLVAKGHNVEIGKPVLNNFYVEGKILTHGKDEKITVVKFKSKKRYQRKRGHRQSFTEIEVLGVHEGIYEEKPLTKIESIENNIETEEKKPKKE